VADAKIASAPEIKDPALKNVDAAHQATVEMLPPFQEFW